MKKKILKLYFFFKRVVLLSLNNNLRIEPDVQIRATKIRKNGKIIIQRGSRIGINCFLSPDGGTICIGKYTSINSFSVLSGAGNINIGQFVAIAPRCAIIAFNHKFDSLDKPIKKQGISKKGIIIEDDVWLGTGVTVLDGVTIGKGSVIGAGSVVTKNIPPYSVAVGIPARVIKSRLSDDNKV